MSVAVFGKARARSRALHSPSDEEQGTRPHAGFIAFRTAASISGALYVMRYANLPRAGSAPLDDGPANGRLPRPSRGAQGWPRSGARRAPATPLNNERALAGALPVRQPAGRVTGRAPC